MSDKRLLCEYAAFEKLNQKPATADCSQHFDSGMWVSVISSPQKARACVHYHPEKAWTVSMRLSYTVLMTIAHVIDLFTRQGIPCQRKGTTKTFYVTPTFRLQTEQVEV